MHARGPTTQHAARNRKTTIAQVLLLLVVLAGHSTCASCAMRWQSNRRRAISSSSTTPTTQQTKTFLVLPLVDDSDNSSSVVVAAAPEMNKNNGNQLRLFTKTWPPKGKGGENSDEENTRPLTATLDKPQVLDIRLIGKIDMSMMRKEFLTITSLCRIPLTHRKKLIERRRPLSNLPLGALTSPANDKAASKLKQRRLDAASDDSWEDESSLSSSHRECTRKLTSRLRPPTIIIRKPNDSNNNLSKLRSNKPKSSSCDLKVSAKASIKQLPEPCTTCGRPDQPERFHSHPQTPLKPIKRGGVVEQQRMPVKSTVQKPIAIKYKSKLDVKIDEHHQLQLQRKMSLPTQKLQHTPPATSITNLKTKSARGPRTLTCYICAREFGTASLPLHEPKCLQKWERENATLPPHLRKQPPIKPQGNLSKEEWNRSAWEASQASLVACQNCGRTFYPDRLIVHMRSCKTPQRGANNKSNDSLKRLNPPAPIPSGPPTVQCSYCNKLFGTKSIKIHEPQCLKKWHMRNDHLPTERREPFPGQKDESGAMRKQDDVRPPSPKRPSMLPCYLCGRLFSLSSIYIHEPQCLKKWRLENEKLPAHKQRPEPVKPDIKFTQDGKIDFNATDEAIWQCHLNQLVPCQHCKRTFNPDRVDVHERSCKGPN